ncbi:hypothetical protein [uncultured Sphingomonas sp.]|uniref:hypothetical protein n=1 Tax=uncultured Sphingomonas sp. TaxID=158754 RepID=UPI0025D6F528|nr:hypothetical protein [uncultured Sphingomonas sp.]
MRWTSHGTFIWPYTRDYWHRLCRDIVGRDIHHEPTSGYRFTFCESPPADIWPDPADRFAGRFVRVDLTQAPGRAEAARTAVGAAGMAAMLVMGRHWAVAMILTLIAVVALCRSFGGVRCGEWRAFEWDLGGLDGSGGGDGGCGSGCGRGCS